MNHSARLLGFIVGLTILLALSTAFAQTRLLVWDSWVEDTTAMDELVAQFTAENPDIEIVRESIPPETMRDILRTALDAGEGPDIMYYDTGPGFAGILARAGLLLPLDQAYEQYGWNERILPWTKERTRFDGQTYGIAHELETIGVYYNQRIFEELGLSEPQSHEEVLQLCQTVQEAGLYPIAFGNQPKWPATHTFSVFANNIVGKEKVAAALSGEHSWSDEDLVAAIEIPFNQMRDAGCYNPDPNAVSYGDANLLFMSGQAAMQLTGTWRIAPYADPAQMPDPVGFFFYPSINGSEVVPPAGVGSGYFVSANTENPEAAYRFLDFLFSEQAAAHWLEGMNRIPPLELNAGDYEIPELLQLVLEDIQNNSAAMGYNIDVLAPDNFNAVMFDGLQEVIGGVKTAEQQANDHQQAMEAAKAAGKVIDITD
jgi:raffinose/stachyose/melibiose transport system substrate-binding protein